MVHIWSTTKLVWSILKLCLTYRPVGYLYVPLSTIAIQDRPLRGVRPWAPHLTSCRLSNVVKYGQNQRTLLQVQYTIHKYLQSNYTSILECQNARWNAIEYTQTRLVCIRCHKRNQNDLDDTGKWCGSKWSEFRFLSCKMWLPPFSIRHIQLSSKDF